MSDLKRILVVDDDQTLARVVGQVFQRSGKYESRVITDPRDAVEAARDFQPHALVLDVVMPRMDGGEVLAAIRAEPGFEGIPAVFLTGIVSASEVGSHAYSGDVPLVAKPMKPGALMAALAEVLGE